MLGARADRPHGTGHDILASLPVDVELLVLDVELNEGQPRVQPVLAVKSARIDARVRRTLDVAGLQPAVLEAALAVGAGYHLATTVGIELRMLAVTQVDLVLLLGTRVETEVGLVGEVVRVEEHANEGRFRDEGLGLLGFAAEDARFLAVVHLRFRVAVRYLCGRKSVR